MITRTSTRRPASLVATLRLKSICEAFAEWAKSVKLLISVVKTIFILFSRRHRSSLEDITLDLFGQRVSPALNAQYLGLLLDWRLSWRDHIEAKCLAAKRLSFMVRRFVGAKWGLSGQRIRTIYTSVVEPTILYCCSVWCSSVNRASVKSILRSTQRTFTIAITRSFGSVSTEALLVISSVIPIDLKIKETAAARFCALSHSNSFSPRSFSTVNQCFFQWMDTSNSLHPHKTRDVSSPTAR